MNKKTSAKDSLRGQEIRKSLCWIQMHKMHYFLASLGQDFWFLILIGVLCCSGIGIRIVDLNIKVG